MSRKNAREDAFRLIFEGMVNSDDANERLERYFGEVADPCDDCAFVNKPAKGDNDFVRKVFLGVEEKREQLDAVISSCLKGWELGRISKISTAAMRLAVYEMMYVDDVPTGVSINEAVEIVKKYDNKQAGAFVNGALSSAAKQMVSDDGN